VDGRQEIDGEIRRGEMRKVYSVWQDWSWSPLCLDSRIFPSPNPDRAYKGLRSGLSLPSSMERSDVSSGSPSSNNNSRNTSLTIDTSSSLSNLLFLAPLSQFHYSLSSLDSRQFAVHF
jgi:hypothetical protein